MDFRGTVHSLSVKGNEKQESSENLLPNIIQHMIQYILNIFQYHQYPSISESKMDLA